MESIEQALFTHFPYANLVLHVSAPKEFTLKLCNPAAAALYGINAQAVGGKQLHHVLVKPMADFLESACAQCLKEQKLIVLRATDLNPLTDGLQSFTLNPIFDDRGYIAYINITALPFDADKLELQKERDHALMLMSSAFDASNLGIFVTDKERRVLRVNEAFIREFGFRRRDIIGADFTTIFEPDDRRTAVKAYKDFLRGQSEARYEWRLKTPDNKEVDVLVTTAPLHLHPDRPLVIHTFVDISEHKHLEESLRWAKEQADAANRAKSAFLASMSHELRTPLNAILGFSELTKNETFGPLGHPKYSEYMNDIHFAAQHLLEIINDVLDMSKIEAGKFELIEQEIDVRLLLESVSRVMQDRADAARVKIDITVDERFENLYADKRVLRQMLFNLLSNAIKFSYPGTTIDISAAIDDKTGAGRLSVRDHGRGIDPKDLQSVMEPFNQGQASVSDGTGTGLGLPLTRAMAELHGGRLLIESQIGKGTTVTIVMPVTRFMPRAANKNAKRAV